MASAAPVSSSPPWVELPREITGIILHKLGAIEILTSAQMVCRTWRSVCLDPAMWRVIDMHLHHHYHEGNFWDSPYNMENLYRLAVDRSHGQLTDINIEFFATDDLLSYIAQRSAHLRCLRLVFCYSFSSDGLIEAVKSFPLLEELQVYYTRITREVIEAVGRSCPLLKSFRLNNQGSRRPRIECDEEAFAVAENMPGLRRLQLFGNKMTNEGLQAILNGCSVLESLDLRQCFNVSLTGSLARRCSQQINVLRCPYDSTEDYEFDAKIEDFESSDEDYPFQFSDIELLSDDDDYYAFSDRDGEYSEYAEMLID